jgi:hypothetical protein
VPQAGNREEGASTRGATVEAARGTTHGLPEAVMPGHPTLLSHRQRISAVQGERVQWQIERGVACAF